MVGDLVEPVEGGVAGVLGFALAEKIEVLVEVGAGLDSGGGAIGKLVVLNYERYVESKGCGPFPARLKAATARCPGGPAAAWPGNSAWDRLRI